MGAGALRQGRGVEEPCRARSGHAAPSSPGTLCAAPRPAAARPSTAAATPPAGGAPAAGRDIRPTFAGVVAEAMRQRRGGARSPAPQNPARAAAAERDWLSPGRDAVATRSYLAGWRGVSRAARGLLADCSTTVSSRSRGPLQLLNQIQKRESCRMARRCSEKTARRARSGRAAWGMTIVGVRRRLPGRPSAEATKPRPPRGRRRGGPCGRANQGVRPAAVRARCRLLPRVCWSKAPPPGAAAPIHSSKNMSARVEW